MSASVGLDGIPGDVAQLLVFEEEIADREAVLRAGQAPHHRGRQGREGKASGAGIARPRSRVAHVAEAEWVVATGQRDVADARRDGEGQAGQSDRCEARHSGTSLEVVLEV